MKMLAMKTPPTREKPSRAPLSRKYDNVSYSLNNIISGTPLIRYIITLLISSQNLKTAQPTPAPHRSPPHAQHRTHYYFTTALRPPSFPSSHLTMHTYMRLAFTVLLILIAVTAAQASTKGSSKGSRPTRAPTTNAPTTAKPTSSPTTASPTTAKPTKTQRASSIGGVCCNPPAMSITSLAQKKDACFFILIRMLPGSLISNRYRVSFSKIGEKIHYRIVRTYSR